MRTIAIAGLFIASLVLMTAGAAAHLGAGTDVTKDGYMIDFGYTPEDPRAGDSVNFLLILLNESEHRTLEPDSAWVRISGEEGILFSGLLLHQNGSFTFNYLFSEAGKYEVSAEFRGDGQALVSHTFDIEIEEGQAEEEPEEEGLLDRYRFGFWMFIVEAILLVLIIAGIVILNRKRKE